MQANQPNALTKTGVVLLFVRGVKRYFIAGAVLAVLSTLADNLRPRIIQFTVDSVIGAEAPAVSGITAALLARLGGVAGLRARLWLPALAVLGCSLAGILLRYWHTMCIFRGGEGFVKNMRDMLFGHLQHLSVGWHNAHQTGDIIQRCTSDVEGVKVFLSEQMVNLLTIVISIITALVFMFRVDGRLPFVALAEIPLIGGFSFWFHRRIGAAFRRCDENEGVLSTIAQENLTGVRVVRAFGRERWEKQRFLAQNEIVTEHWVQLGRYMSIYWGASDLTVGLVTLVVLTWGSVLCVQGQCTVGSLLAILLYMASLNRPVRMLGRVLSEMSKAGVSIERLREIMAAPAEQDAPGASTPPMDGDIRFEHVSFGYPGQPELLHDVSFTIPAGTTLGILGGTGSGKSTLMNLLARLYPLAPEQGRITVGGEDIQAMQAAWVRRNVGYVLQEPYLFSRSIAQNIAIAQPDMGMGRIRRAARAACLESVVDTFAHGFDTFVGERGVTLSGGQKQRTAIARTLSQASPILVFDDSLSAVDSETDAAIRENLRQYMGKATVILISHRITTLMAADQILVLEDGRVTACGTHAQLAAQPGLYRTICQIQQGGEQDG